MFIRTQHRTVLRSLFWGAVLLSAGTLFGDGFIIPNPPTPRDRVPPLSVKYHRVTVEIADQVAKTTVDQVFLNTFDRDIEGTYIFPLPPEAALSEFAMWVGDQKVTGEILDAEAARRVYEDIVRRLRDPAILEYMGRNMFRARVYPIPARGEKRIRLSYTEMLKSERNFVRYRYPLSPEQLSLDPIGDVRISVAVASRVPLANVYSPTHKISVPRDSASRATASYEATAVRPDKDFVLYYSLSPDDIGLSFVQETASDGKYFMLLAAPPLTVPRERAVAKNVVFVLDSSGSMGGTKIRQAREAARFVINHLAADDRFSVIDFDDGVNLFAPDLQPVREDTRAKALKFVDGVEDGGGTNIDDALEKALKMMTGERPNYVLFLTDGQPTVGVTETGEILKHFDAANAARARVFVFGVGTDVNTELLDKIAERSRGTSVYVTETDNLEFAISAFYDKIAAPLLSDISLEFKGIEVRDRYPRTLPDLFRGSQLIIVGRYTGDGPVTVTLTGSVGKDVKRFVLDDPKLFSEETLHVLPRLWATRRIGYLLEEIRLNGTSVELVDEVRALGLKYGIVTPYTSFLVTERERQMIAAAAPEAQEALTARHVSGAGAVKMAAATQALKNEDLAAQATSELIRYKDDKTFYLKNGVWEDSVYREGSSMTEIAFNSDAYFRLIAVKPGLAKYLSVATKLIVRFEGVNYKIVE